VGDAYREDRFEMPLPGMSLLGIDIDKTISSGNKYLGNVETALLLALVQATKPRVMIEFGVRTGLTADIMLNRVSTLEQYIGIDVPWGTELPLPCQRTETPIVAGCHVRDKRKFELMLSAQGSLDLDASKLPACDAVFIDGDHSKRTVLHDSRLARELIRPGGVIVWHDYDNPAVEVTQALDQLHDEGWSIQHLVGTWLAVMYVH
jgi:predicted O-methyltransferase YrrM